MKTKRISVGLLGVVALFVGGSFAHAGIFGDWGGFGDTVNIIGGSRVSASDPITSSTVALLAGGALCTASIIDDDTAVTAAHCVVDSDPSQMALVFGNRVSGATVKVRVASAMANEGYTGHGSQDNHDIAIVRFEGGIPAGYSKVKILTNTKGLRAGQSITLAGYGITNALTHVGAGTLRMTNVTIENANFGKTEILFDQSEGAGACHGDSGGPAFVKSGSQLLLLGVTSRGGPGDVKDDCAHDAVYTKVSPYVSWIRSAQERLRAAK